MESDLRTKAMHRLNYLCDTLPDLLMKIEEPTFSYKPNTNKWSKKEILGHLIDSATNNHQRFVRAQFEDTPTIGYDQNKWNEFNYYQKISGSQLISFWTYYNKQLIEIIKNIPDEKLRYACRSGDSLYTLEFLIQDYVLHLEHHLKQVVTY